MFKKLFLFFFLFFLFSLDVAPFTLRIDKPKLRLKIRPGETLNGVITVTNPSEDSIKVKVYAEDFKYVAPFDGTKKFLPPGSTKLSCSKWISFSPQGFILPPFGERIVSYSINVPSQVSGGYYSVLFFEATMGEAKDRQGRDVLVLGRIGALFFLETEDSFKNIKVTESLSSEDKIKLSLSNGGNVITSVKGIFYILDSRGLVADRGKTNELFLPPGEMGSIGIDLPSDISEGNYQAVLTLDLEEGDVKVVEITFSKYKTGEIKILEVRE